MSPTGIGVAHLPNQRHKIVAKRGANFTLMVCGTFYFFSLSVLYMDIPSPPLLPH